MHTRHLAILLLFAMLLLALTGCSQQKAEVPTTESNYQAAISLLQEGKYSEAASAFAALGHYYDSSRYAMYSSALTSAEKGDFSLAASSMQALQGFMDSSILSVYYTARAFEADEAYETAYEAYTQILQFGDAGTRAQTMPGKALERDYSAACALEESKAYTAAISAFEALNGYSDSAEHIAAMRKILAEQQKAEEEQKLAQAYTDADALETAGKLEEAAAAFRALGTYSDSEARVTAVEGKIIEQKYQSAIALEAQDDLISAYALYTELADYNDAAARAAAIHDEAAYRSAFITADNGQYADALTAYTALADYKDAAEKARLLGVCRLAQQMKRLNSGVFSFKLQDLWGYIDLNNNYDVAPAYDSITRFSANTGLAIVSGADEYALIDREGRLLSPRSYIGIAEGENGFYTAVRKGTKYAYDFILINAEGKELSTWKMLGSSTNSDVNSKYNQYSLNAPAFTNGVMIGVDSLGLSCLVNAMGETVISGAMNISLVTRKASNDTALVYWGKRGYQLIDLDGKPLSEDLWSEVGNFRNGYAAVSYRGSWGYISSEDCRVVIEPQYEGAGDFSDGYAAVRSNGLWGYIDAENNMVIAPKYMTANTFSNEHAAVMDSEVGWQVIDKTGKLLYFKQNSYLAADTLDQAGEYEQAIAGFEALDGYADSSVRAQQSREKINATVYASAEKLEAAGKYIEAAETFEWLGAYSDAATRATAARETQNATTYASAAALEDKGQLEEAIAVYLTLGDYQGSAQHAADMRESINQGICAQADALEADEKYEQAIKVLNQIPEYTGVAEHVTALQEKIRVRDYNAAAALEDAGKFEEAITAFTAMNGYSNSADRITALQEKIRVRDYNAAAALEDAGKFEEAITAFTAMNGYSDSADRIVTLKGKILERDYNAAAALEESGKYADAHAAFVALGNYSDSAARATAVTEKAAEQQRQKDYAAAAAAEESNELETAAAGFEALGDYSDAKTRLAGVKEKILARDYAAAVAVMDSEDYATAVTMFTALGSYQDSAALLAQAKTGMQYQTAVADALAGKIQDAYNAFVALGNYRDSAKKAEICGNLNRASKTQQITEGVLIYEFHQLWGIANLNTNVLTSAKYTSIDNKNGSEYQARKLLKVYIKGSNDYYNQYGYIDHNGKEIIPCVYVGISDFNTDGMCTVAKASTYDGRYGIYYYAALGIMDSTGKSISKPQWYELGSSYNSNDNNSANWWRIYYMSLTSPSFIDGRMKVKTPQQQYGFINDKGAVLGEVKWTSIGDFSDGMAMVGEEFTTGTGYSKRTVTKYGFIDTQGQTIGEVRWDEVKAFSNGYAAVKENDLWGFINKKNELVIPCKYTEVDFFREDGTCDVKTKNGTWEIIEATGDLHDFSGTSTDTEKTAASEKATISETAEAAGFIGDPVIVTVTKYEDGTIAALTVDASTQMAGIGKACEDEAFTSQFIGKTGPFELGNGIDACSGATFTSQGVVDAVNSLYASSVN